MYIVNAWITHKIWLCVLVRREFDHFCWLTWWKITDELRKNYGKITHKSLTNHALQRIGTKRPQTGRMRGCAWRIRDGKPRIISALSLVNCVWIAHDSRMNCAKNAQEALKLRSFRAYKTDAAAVPWRTPSRAQARALCFLLLFGVLGARPTHPVRLQAYMAKQAERRRGRPFPWSPSSRHGNKLYKQTSALAFPFQQSQAAHRFFKFVKFSFFIRVRATQNSCWTQRNLTLRRNLRCGARVRCAPLGSRTWTRTWTDGRWLK